MRSLHWDQYQIYKTNQNLTLKIIFVISIQNSNYNQPFQRQLFLHFYTKKTIAKKI